MTHDDMAAELRLAGWMVRGPRVAAIPDPAAEQVWIATKPGTRIKPRTVVRTALTMWWSTNVPVRPLHGSRQSGRTRVAGMWSWAAWVRKNAAVVATPTAEPAQPVAAPGAVSPALRDPEPLQRAGCGFGEG